MTIENFLSFWSQHNIGIIEGLIGLIIVFSLLLSYRAFFSKGSGIESSDGHGLDTTQIEKALQKILDNQNQVQGSSHSAKASQAAEDLGMNVDLDGMEKEPLGSNSEEVTQLRVAMNESQKKIETLQLQLQEALQKAAELSEGNDSGAASAGDAKQTEELKNKVSDLESRLAEYEIISEDIADLSRYRDENEQLKKELENIKASGSASSVTSPAAPAAPAAGSDANVAPEPAAVSQPLLSEAEISAMASPPPEAAPAAESSVLDSLIDDELMKEFAAAVEGQKAAGSKIANKMAANKAAAEAAKDADKLMDEFENFVTKKS
ncbi:MAG: hypothetical protein ACXVCY_18435 [Pseudobdellovibrionaceae bacterium]